MRGELVAVGWWFTRRGDHHREHRGHGERHGDEATTASRGDAATRRNDDDFTTESTETDTEVPSLNEGFQELAWLGLSSYLDPEVGFRSEHKRNVRMVKNALEKPLGRIHKLSKPILRNSFLYGCVEFTRDEKVEHLVVGFGRRSGGGTNIYKLLHIVGNATSVPLPPALIRLIQAHALEGRSSEAIVFHNHPADWFNAIHRMPLASTADRRLMVQKKFLEPFFLLKTVFGHGTMRFYVAERGRAREIKWPYLKDALDLLATLPKGDGP